MDSPEKRRIRVRTAVGWCVALSGATVVRRFPAALSLSLTVAIALGGCAVAPLVQDAGERGPSVLLQMDSARPAAVTANDGTILRGVLIEDPGAECVILHLLPSATSVTTGVPAGLTRIGLAPTLSTFLEFGFSSLVFDYRGLGDSDGQRDSDHLLEDGFAMWQEAVRFAGGHEDRVIIRAGSLGSLIAADLLDRGARPRAVVLYAPVNDGTVVKHVAHSRYGTFAAFWIQTFYKSPGALDLSCAVRRAEMPILLLLPETDDYFPVDEQTDLREVAQRNGHTIAVHPGDHQTLVLRAWGFTVDQGSFSGRRSPELLEAELEFIGTSGFRVGN